MLAFAVVTIFAVTPVSWSKVTFTLENYQTHTPGQTIEVFADGRVIFGGYEKVARSVAHAPRDLIVKFNAWSHDGPKRGPNIDAAPWVIDVVLEGSKKASATYVYAAMPAEEKALYDGAQALINSPREAEPCTKWDGKGDFTITTYVQDFGATAGPVTRVTLSSSDGKVERFGAGGAADAKLEVQKTTKASKEELDAIRTAATAADLGQYKDVFGGAGEGSNIRTLILKSPAGECARTFTNQWPAGLKQLQDTMAPVIKRL